jgi:hypothetical protein
MPQFRRNGNHVFGGIICKPWFILRQGQNFWFCRKEAQEGAFADQFGKADFSKSDGFV